MKSTRSINMIILVLLLSSLLVGVASGQYEEETSSDDDDVGALLLILLMIGSAIIFGGIPIALAVWVKFDGDRNGVENPLLWALLVWIFGLLGSLLFLGVYILVIRKQGSKGKPVKQSKREKQEEMDIIIKIKPGFCPHCRSNEGRTSGKCSKCSSDLS